jgi:hypothetical protein
MDDRLTRIENARRIRPFTRAIIALGSVGHEGAALTFAKSRWGNDRETAETITRGAVTPTTTTTSGVPTSTALADLLPLLGPSSASGGLFSRSIKLSLGQSSAILIPEITASGSGVAFIAQGSPFPIKQLAFSPTTLGVKKLAFGVVMTRELFEAPSAETLIAQVIAENLSLGIDTLLFDAVAADTTRPAGLKNGVGATAASAKTGNEAMYEDLSNLAAIVAPIAGQQIAFVASPKQAITIQLRKTSDLPFPVFSSAGLADKQVMAIALNSLTVGGDAAPRFEIAKAGAVHMEDTSPAQLSTVGTPNVVSAPITSIFQADLVALRILADLNWVVRAANSVAWTQTVVW